MGHDLKYGRISTEKGDIPDDEPVYLLRAQDSAAVAAILAHKLDAQEKGSPLAFLVGVDEAVRSFESWQRGHETKAPD